MSRLIALRTLTRAILPGVGLVVVLAVAVRAGAELLPAFVAEASLGVIVGLVVANAATVPPRFLPGIRFSSGTLLRLGIVLMGARLAVADVLTTGLGAVALILLGFALVAALTVVVARALRLPTRLSVLLGVGTAVCGNSAIVATAPVIEADETEVAAAVAMITLFGTLAVFVYPLIGSAIGLSDQLYGQWVGLAVSDTSQVTAAGFARSDPAGEIATIVKLTRNAFIGFVVIGIGIAYGALASRPGARGTERRSILRFIPPFVIGFLALAAANSTGWLSPDLRAAAQAGSQALILVALVGLGLQTSLRRLRWLGVRPVWAVLALVTALSATALALSSAMGVGGGT